MCIRWKRLCLHSDVPHHKQVHRADSRCHGYGHGCHAHSPRPRSGHPGNGVGELGGRVGGERGLYEGANGIDDVTKYLGRVFLHVIALTEQSEGGREGRTGGKERGGEGDKMRGREGGRERGMRRGEGRREAGEGGREGGGREGGGREGGGGRRERGGEGEGESNLNNTRGDAVECHAPLMFPFQLEIKDKTPRTPHQFSPLYTIQNKTVTEEGSVDSRCARVQSTITTTSTNTTTLITSLSPNRDHPHPGTYH